MEFPGLKKLFIDFTEGKLPDRFWPKKEKSRGQENKPAVEISKPLTVGVILSGEALPETDAPDDSKKERYNLWAYCGIMILIHILLLLILIPMASADTPKRAAVRFVKAEGVQTIAPHITRSIDNIAPKDTLSERVEKIDPVTENIKRVDTPGDSKNTEEAGKTARIIGPGPLITDTLSDTDMGGFLKGIKGIEHRLETNIGGLDTIKAVRGAEGRKIALGKYGGDETKTETAVMNALEWLKSHQDNDGSWNSSVGHGEGGPALSAMALMCFLAHGEDHRSPKYGATVRKGIGYLLRIVSDDGSVPGQRFYGQGMIAYALAEACIMTELPEVKRKLTKIINYNLSHRKKPDGGWSYGGAGTDMSISGWHMQSIKASQIAGLAIPQQEIDGLVSYCRNMYQDGGFGYQGRGRGTLGTSGAGTLGMIFLGQRKSVEVEGCLNTFKAYAEKKTPYQQWYLYGHYYMTQAMFHRGEEYWELWNKFFRDELIKNQSADGSWPAPAQTPHGWERSYGFVYPTVLNCLSLEVYYRYLASF